MEPVPIMVQFTVLAFISSARIWPVPNIVSEAFEVLPLRVIMPLPVVSFAETRVLLMPVTVSVPLPIRVSFSSAAAGISEACTFSAEVLFISVRKFEYT